MRLYSCLISQSFLADLLGISELHTMYTLFASRPFALCIVDSAIPFFLSLVGKISSILSITSSAVFNPSERISNAFILSSLLCICWLLIAVSSSIPNLSISLFLETNKSSYSLTNTPSSFKSALSLSCLVLLTNVFKFAPISFPLINAFLPNFKKVLYA